jgi:hypothetical protein
VIEELFGLVETLHPDPHALAEVTLGGRRCQGAVRGEDTVVDEPGGGVELGEESLDAPAEPVGRVGDGLEDGSADDGLGNDVSCLKA